MDYDLQTLMQYVSDPQDLADSISAFFQIRSEKIRPTLEKLSEVIDGEITAATFKNDQSVLHKFNCNLSNSLNDVETIDLDEVVDAIEDTIDELDASPTINIYDSTNHVVEEISIEESLNRFRELGVLSDMLVTSLNIAQQYAENPASDFLTSSFAKIEGYLQSSDAAGRLKGVFVAISDELRDNVNDPVSLVESICSHFGLGTRSDDPRANDVSDYRGQSARCVLFTQMADKLGWAIENYDRAFGFVVGVCASIGYGISQLIINAYHGLQAITEKAIAKILELGDGIRPLAIPGRGTIQHPGFMMKFNDQLTSFPAGYDLAEAFTEFKTAIGSDALGIQQYTIPVGPMVLYVNWQIDHMEVTYDIRPINYQVYREVFKDCFGDYPKLFIKAEEGVIKADNTGITLASLTRYGILNFVKKLYEQNNIWGMDYEFDSKKYMCIQASKHLLTMIMALSDSSVDTIDSNLAIELNDAWLYLDVTQEFGYNHTSQAFIPENVNFASVCTYLGTRSSTGKLDCFYSNLSAGNVLDMTDPTQYSWMAAVDATAFVLLTKLAAKIVGNNPENIGNFFVPYFHKFKLYRPSYYIPTDTDNVTHLKRMIITGLAVVGVIAITAITVVLASKFKKKKWQMEQIAAQKAFTASEKGDPSLLAEGWKLQKKVNLMGALSGAAVATASPITSGVTTVYDAIVNGPAEATPQDYSIKSVVTLIKG